MKIPFDIKFKPQIESGEYKVETRSGKQVRVICWNKKSTTKMTIVVLCDDGDSEHTEHYTEKGTVYDRTPAGGDLFIITPEPELSEFEKAVGLELFDEPFEERHIKVIKEESAKLLDLARKELEPEVLERLEAAYKNQDEVVYENGKRDGKSEALRTRATELTENLVKSRLDKDSIPYHLIEFMCNLYTCQNWKEIEETAEAYVTRIKAAAIKDLPRWRKAADRSCVGQSIMFDEHGFYSAGITKPGCRYINCDSLTKLQGFKD